MFYVATGLCRRVQSPCTIGRARTCKSSGKSTHCIVRLIAYYSVYETVSLTEVNYITCITSDAVATQYLTLTLRSIVTVTKLHVSTATEVVTVKFTQDLGRYQGTGTKMYIYYPHGFALCRCPEENIPYASNITYLPDINNESRDRIAVFPRNGDIGTGRKYTTTARDVVTI